MVLCVTSNTRAAQHAVSFLFYSREQLGHLKDVVDLDVVAGVHWGAALILGQLAGVDGSSSGVLACMHSVAGGTPGTTPSVSVFLCFPQFLAESW